LELASTSDVGLENVDCTVLPDSVSPASGSPTIV
ncbi:hypothetical protein SOVF_142610, partial [Spinacia oleracea]